MPGLDPGIHLPDSASTSPFRGRSNRVCRAVADGHAPDPIPPHLADHHRGRRGDRAICARPRPVPTEPPKPTGGAISGRARVVDGDSLIIGASRIRLFGIDAPEGRQDCRDAQGGSYRSAREPRARARRPDRRPRGDLHAGRRSHDRSVAVCTVEGRDLSEAMVRGGHAVELRQHSHGRYARRSATRATASADCGPALRAARPVARRDIRAIERDAMTAE